MNHDTLILSVGDINSIILLTNYGYNYYELNMTNVLLTYRLRENLTEYFSTVKVLLQCILSLSPANQKTFLGGGVEELWFFQQKATQI